MSEATRALQRQHLRIGWWATLVFLALGIGLEALHGLKIGAYLDLANTTRRHMWTLAHAHGTLLGLVNIAFALTVGLLYDARPSGGWRSTSVSLLGATILMPTGFFLGGVTFYGGDPGLGIALVPIGAFALLYAVWQVARRT